MHAKTPQIVRDLKRQNHALKTRLLKVRNVPHAEALAQLDAARLALSAVNDKLFMLEGINSKQAADLSRITDSERASFHAAERLLNESHVLKYEISQLEARISELEAAPSEQVAEALAERDAIKARLSAVEGVILKAAQDAHAAHLRTLKPSDLKDAPPAPTVEDLDLLPDLEQITAAVAESFELRGQLAAESMSRMSAENAELKAEVLPLQMENAALNREVLGLKAGLAGLKAKLRGEIHRSALICWASREVRAIIKALARINDSKTDPEAAQKLNEKLNRKITVFFSGFSGRFDRLLTLNTGAFHVEPSSDLEALAASTLEIDQFSAKAEAARQAIAIQVSALSPEHREQYVDLMASAGREDLVIEASFSGPVEDIGLAEVTGAPAPTLDLGLHQEDARPVEGSEAPVPAAETAPPTDESTT